MYVQYVYPVSGHACSLAEAQHCNARSFVLLFLCLHEHVICVHCHHLFARRSLVHAVSAYVCYVRMLIGKRVTYYVIHAYVALIVVWTIQAFPFSH